MKDGRKLKCSPGHMLVEANVILNIVINVDDKSRKIIALSACNTNNSIYCIDEFTGDWLDVWLTSEYVHSVPPAEEG